jgi:von Willebrand factor type A domain
MRKPVRTCVSALVLAALASVIALACGGADSGSTFGSSGSSGASSGGASSGGASSSGDFGGNDGGGGGGFGDACAATSSKGQQQPLDLFIMLDQSQSMTDPVATGGDKWTAITAALNAFVTSPQAGVSVGLQYFGLPPGGAGDGGSCVDGAACQSNGDCGTGRCTRAGRCLCGGGGGGGGRDSCNAADYAVPDVEIAPLPGNAAAITASIARHSPSTSTPTSAALQGAIDHATTWSKAHTGDVTIVVLATDGDPTECAPTDIPSIAQIAAAGANGTPKILTFVIGVGSSTSNLNAIAAGGGTTTAFVVDTNANAQQQFLDALNKIRGSALGCTYAIPVPTSGSIDFGEVNVTYTPSGGGRQILPKVGDATQCPASGMAWYYDNNAKPTQILLCKATCDTVLADAKGEVDVALGCTTVVR